MTPRSPLRIAVVGGSLGGLTAACLLRDAGHDVLVLEQDPEVVARRRRTEGIEWREADACEFRSLEESDDVYTISFERAKELLAQPKKSMRRARQAPKELKALGIDVMNLSLGHPIYESAATDPLVQAIERAVSAGIVVVVSAGNHGMNYDTGLVGLAGLTSPGNSPSALTMKP